MKKFIALAFLIYSASLFGQAEYKVDLNQFIEETQEVLSTENNDLVFSWWIPIEYWRIALQDTEDVSEEVILGIESAFDKYVLICVADGKSNDGQFDFKSYKSVYSGITVEDSSGNKLRPVKRKDIPEGTAAILNNIRPMLAQLLGQMGEGMHLFLFEHNDPTKFNLKEKGQLSINLGKYTFDYLLPLPSVLAPKTCPNDQKAMQGNWIYCPFHGNKLEE